MNRLDTERFRLFGTDTTATDGKVRAAAIDIQQRAGWEAVAAIWQGVQDDLDLPAPAVAINGSDGYQLWFSLTESVAADTLLDWLDAVRQRYASAWPAARFKVIPSTDALTPASTGDLPIPPRLCGDGSWSAFVAPGLAPMFADEPWLDLAPSADAQADLLLPLRSINPAEWARALQRLCEPSAGTPAAEPTTSEAPPATPPVDSSKPAVPTLPTTTDPRQFLLAVMTHPEVALDLRIEAAKALLGHA